MKLGITATRRGMNARQLEAFVGLLKAFNPTEFHHGDCVGGDAQAHSLVREHLPKCKIHVHPMASDRNRAFCKGDVTYTVAQPLDRNKHIVNSVDLLAVGPHTNKEQQRSGTWSTYRYAKRQKKNMAMLWPEPQP